MGFEKINHILKEVKVILLDIEGTTTPISFVTDVLFPYASENVKPYLTLHYEDENMKDIISSLQDQCKKDAELEKNASLSFANVSLVHDNKSVIIQCVVDYILWLTKNDKKVTSLKELQGLIWKSAYESGKIKGIIYDDLLMALKTWKSNGKVICIYSSGSIQAQKLLFGYSTDGDLLPYFFKHFDTHIGGKKEAKSYSEIAKNLNVKPCDILFFTDVIAEADAANEAGVKVSVVCRPGNKPIERSTCSYCCIDDFSHFV